MAPSGHCCRDEMLYELRSRHLLWPALVQYGDPRAGSEIIQHLTKNSRNSLTLSHKCSKEKEDKMEQAHTNGASEDVLEDLTNLESK